MKRANDQTKRPITYAFATTGPGVEMLAIDQHRNKFQEIID